MKAQIGVRVVCYKWYPSQFIGAFGTIEGISNGDVVIRLDSPVNGLYGPWYRMYVSPRNIWDMFHSIENPCPFSATQ